MDKAKILRLLDEADDIVSALYRQGANKDYKCKSLREKLKAIGAEIIATDNPADSTELHKVSSRPKSEQYVCISCGKFCYYPHCKAGIQYRFCPNCGREVRGYA